MGKTVNQTELAEIVGVSDVTLWQWQKSGMPVKVHGLKGQSNQYDTAEVFTWRINQELARAGKAESQRDREARLRGDMLEMEINQQRDLLVPKTDVVPVWEERVRAASAYQLGRASRLAGELDSTPGIEAKRALLRREDALFLEKLGVHGEAMQRDVEELLTKVSELEAQAFLQRMASYDQKPNPDQTDDGGVAGPDTPQADPPV